MRLELTKRLSLQASQLYSDCLVSMAIATSPLLHPSVLEHLQALEYLTLLNAGEETAGAGLSGGSILSG